MVPPPLALTPPAPPNPFRPSACRAGWGLLGWFLSSFSLSAETPPNVLFILCDDLRPQALGCYGNTAVHTPNIDRLAREGVRFANTFCTTSLCSPSRASILTGLYAHAHGVQNNFTELPAALPHWPQRLQAAGYETAYLGKWHMGEENDAPRPGFDYFVTHRGQGKYFGTEWNLNGERSVTPPTYYTTYVTDLALEWLRRPRQKPWALCIGHKAPHSFYFPEEKYKHTYDDVPVPYPDTAFQLEDKPAWIRERLFTWHGIFGPLFEWRQKFPDDSAAGVRDFSRMVHAYWGTIQSVDDSLARLRAFLEETGQLEHTVIVLMGDNGLLEGEHGMVDKRTMHEPSIRIPLLMRAPTLGSGLVIQEQVLTEDLTPTLLELCGAPPLAGIHGRSVVKLVREGDPAWRHSWLYEYNYEPQFPYTPNVRGVRTDRWVYMHYPPGDGSPEHHLAELYDLQSDPGERHNLIGNPAYADKLHELQAELIRTMQASGLEPKDDRMPLDEGIKKALPDQKIR